MAVITGILTTISHLCIIYDNKERFEKEFPSRTPSEDPDCDSTRHRLRTVPAQTGSTPVRYIQQYFQQPSAVSDPSDYHRTRYSGDFRHRKGSRKVVAYYCPDSLLRHRIRRIAFLRDLGVGFPETDRGEYGA